MGKVSKTQESAMNKTLEISAMQYDFHILTNTNQK